MVDELEPEQDEEQEEEEEEPLAAEPIVGQTLLEADDFKHAWSAMPEVHTTLLWFAATAASIPFAFKDPERPFGVDLFIAIGLVESGLAFGVLTLREYLATARAQSNDGVAVRFKFDDYGCHVRGAGGDWRRKWRALRGYIETKQAFLIYLTQVATVIVPKRAFAPQEQARLRAELSTRIRQRNKHGGGRLLLFWAILMLAFLAVWRWISAG